MVEVEEEPLASCRRCSLAALGVVSRNEMSWTKLENDMTFQNELVFCGTVRCWYSTADVQLRWAKFEISTQKVGGADAVLTEAIVRIRSGSLQSNDCDWLTGQTLEG